MSDIYSSQRLDIRRPPIFVSIIDFIGGALLILMGIVIGIRFTSLLELIGTTIDRIGDGPVMIFFLLSYTLTIIIGLVVVIVGIKLIIHGITEIISPWRPSNIPANFQNYDAIYKAFRNRILSCYSQTSGRLHTLFGPNTMFLSPVQRVVISSSADAIGGHITGMVFSAIFIAGLIVVGKNFGFKPILSIFIFTLILCGVLSVIDYALSLMILPRYQPNTVATEATEFFRGFGHPAQLISRLNDSAVPLRWRNFQNRVVSTWNESSSASVNDVGQFTGSVFIEQQPQPLNDNISKTAYLMLTIGWILALIGYGTLLFFQLPTGPINAIRLALYMTGAIIFGFVSVKNGNRMIKKARTILESTRFRSPAILMDFGGNLAKAEIKLGSSMVDSIQSNNVSVRSDFTVRFWSAEVISESEKLDAPREILALNQTSESVQWIGFFREAIAKLREERIRPVGVDIQADEAQEIVQANVAISAMRVSAQQKAVAQVGIGNSDTPPSLPASHMDEVKTCPNCDVIQIPGSKFCHSCGTKLD